MNSTNRTCNILKGAGDWHQFINGVRGGVQGYQLTMDTEAYPFFC